VPKGTNWDLWLGPRESRPLSACLHPRHVAGLLGFRGPRPSATSSVTTSTMPAGPWTSTAPTSIEAYERARDGYMAPPGGIYYYQFPARGKMPPSQVLLVRWRDAPAASGRTGRDDQLGARRQMARYSSGDKGMITCPGLGGRSAAVAWGQGWTTSSGRRKTLARSKGHHRDWLDACKGGSPASANFEYGAALTEMACLAWWRCASGKKRWNGTPAAMKSPNAPRRIGF